MPECRICHLAIKKEKEKENIDWIMPSKNYYYHKKCYETWKETPTSEQDWIDLIYDFLSRDLKVSYDYFKCSAQIKKFWKENKINPKGIYFTLKYFYEIKNNTWSKGYGGLGIVPYVFTEAKNYWIEQERKKHGFIEQLEKQIKERKVIKIKRQNQTKNKYNLEEVEGLE